MKKLEVNQMENLEGGKFWGWSEPNWGECQGNGRQYAVVHYYALFVNVDSDLISRPC